MILTFWMKCIDTSDIGARLLVCGVCGSHNVIPSGASTAMRAAIVNAVQQLPIGSVLSGEALYYITALAGVRMQ